MNHFKRNMMAMRSFAAASCLALTCLGIAQDRSLPVTYKTRAARASVVLKQLSDLTKVDLETSPQTENEILLISVKDVSLNDLMAKIAIAASADWRQEGSKFRLVANKVMRRKEDDAEAAKRIGDVRKAIADREAQAKKMRDRFAKMMADEAKKTAAKADTKKGDKQEAAPDFSEMPPVNPDETAFNGLLREIDPTPLALMEPGERVVYATDANKTQHPLGPSATEILNTFIKAHNEMVAQQPPEAVDQNNGVDTQQAEMIRKFMKRQNSKIGTVSKALLIASDSGFGIQMGVMLELRLYDAKGNVLFSGNSNLAVNGENPFMGAMATDAEDTSVAVAAPPQPAKAANAGPPQKRTPIQLSEDSKAIQESTKGMATGMAMMQIKPELRKHLLMPSLYDPLSFLDSDELLAYGTSRQRPIVADLPDGEDSLFGLFGNEGKVPSLEEFTESINKGTAMVSVPDDTFTIIKSARPTRTRMYRTDRIALTALVQASEEKGVPSVDDLSAYAVTSPSPMQGKVSQMYLMLFVPGSLQMGLDGGQWSMLRLYGHLPEEARNTLINGGRIGLGNLPGASRADADLLVYGSGNRLTVDDGKKSGDEDLPSFMRASLSMFNDSSDYRTEPTEVAPNGLPNDGFVELKGVTEPFATIAGENTSPITAMLGALGPEEFALLNLMKSQKGAEMLSAMLPPMNRLKVGSRSVMNFTFHIAPQVVVKETLKDHHIDKNAAIVSEKSLPSDFMKLIANKMEALKKSSFGQMGSFFGGGGNAIHP